MKQFKTSPRALVLELWKNRGLIYSLVYREVMGRYKGSAFGLLWSFINPLLLLSVYTFVFSIIFRRTWGGNHSSPLEFGLILFAGLIVFNIFAECLSKSPTLITSKAVFVKKVVFPLEVLPTATLGAALFQSLVNCGVWLIAFLVILGLPPISILLSPFMLLPMILFVLGFSWIVSSLGVYIRDLNQLVGVFITINLFLSAVFFPITSIPEQYRSYVMMSPIAAGVEFFRQTAFFGIVPDMGLFLIHLFLGALTAMLGFAWFQKTRKGFADVI